MGAILLALGTLLSGIAQPIKDYLGFKVKEADANRELKLAQIQADKEAVVANAQAQTSQVQSYLNATSRQFRQHTFYFILIPLLISVLAPEYAAGMWANFEAIPEWFRILFVSIYGVIWGLPIAKDQLSGMFAAAGRGLASHREYKLEKLNRKVIYENLRKDIFTKGMTPQQVESIERALDAGEK